jgi:hypothetical protein
LGTGFVGKNLDLEVIYGGSKEGELSIFEVGNKLGLGKN